MKTAKKGICLVLALVLCLGLFVACGENDGDGNGDGEAPALSGTLLGGIDAKTVIMEIEGEPVLWEVFFYDLQNFRHMLEFQGPLPDWDDVFADQTRYPSEMTYNEFAIRYAIDAALERRAMEMLYMGELGGSVEPEFYEEVREMFLLEQGMDEEMFYDFLEEHFLTEDTFRYLNEAMLMHERAMEAIAGLEGELVSDEAVAEYIEAAGILGAKHILISAEDEDDIAATARAEELYEELSALEGEAQIERFNEMLVNYGEDPGMEANPEGYVFTPGVMVPEFTIGTEVLEIGEIGPPVRSDFGYHIILRTSVDRTALPMMAGGGQPMPIQFMAARIELEQRTEEIRERLNYETTPLLATIVPSEIFAVTA